MNGWTVIGIGAAIALLLAVADEYLHLKRKKGKKQGVFRQG